MPGIKLEQRYGYRVDGPADVANGHRFDRNKVLIDPYVKSTWMGPRYSPSEAGKPGDNAFTSMKSVIAYLDSFDWYGDRLLKRPFRETAIYEMHVAALRATLNLAFRSTTVEPISE